MKKALVAALTAATLLAPASAFAQVGNESGDERIVAAREALRKGDRATLERLAAVREAHPLDAYPRYWLLASEDTAEYHHFGMEWKEHVAWITPNGTHSNKLQGVGVQFKQDEGAAALRARIEELLAGMLMSAQPTHTM